MTKEGIVEKGRKEEIWTRGGEEDEEEIPEDRLTSLSAPTPKH